MLAGGAAAVFALLAYVYVTLPDVRALRTTNPASTAWMELRAREAEAAGRPVRRIQRWVPYGRISHNLKRAVIVAEDSAFWEHEGVDIEQIRESMAINLEKGQAARGASTITQQLAKNLYLSPSRNPIRKLRELIIARRLETELSKARIFEIYLNVIEMGRRDLGCGSRRAALFRRACRRADGAAGGAAGRRHHQPAALQSGTTAGETSAAAAHHHAAHGCDRTSRGGTRVDAGAIPAIRHADRRASRGASGRGDPVSRAAVHGNSETLTIFSRRAVQSRRRSADECRRCVFTKVPKKQALQLDAQSFGVVYFARLAP